MSVSAATLKLLMAAGLEGDQLLAIVESMEADMASASPTAAAAEPDRTARQERNARYYQRKRLNERLKASDSDVLQASYSDVLNPSSPEQRKVSPHPSKETQPLPPRSSLRSDLPPSAREVVEAEIVKAGEPTLFVIDNPLPVARPQDDVPAALEAYNVAARAAGWSVAQHITPDRRTKLLARLRDCGGIDGWRAAMAKAVGTPFLCGDNDRGWRASIDFFLQAKSFTKLMEGAYDHGTGDRPSGRPAGHRPSPHDAFARAVAQDLAEHPDSRFGREARARGLSGFDDG